MESIAAKFQMRSSSGSKSFAPGGDSPGLLEGPDAISLPPFQASSDGMESSSDLRRLLEGRLRGPEQVWADEKKSQLLTANCGAFDLKNKRQAKLVLYPSSHASLSRITQMQHSIQRDARCCFVLAVHRVRTWIDQCQ